MNPRSNTELASEFRIALNMGADPFAGWTKHERRALVRDARDTVAGGCGDTGAAQELLSWAGAGEHWTGIPAQRDRDWEFRSHGSAGGFGSESSALAALDAAGCGDVYGPAGVHETLRCSDCCD
jgi:hypothetical protein